MSDGEDDELEEKVPGLSEEVMYDRADDSEEPKEPTDSEKPEEASDLTLNGQSEKEAARTKEAEETASHGHTPVTLNVVHPKKRDFFHYAGLVIGAFLIFSIGSVCIHRFVPVPITVLMIERLLQGNGLDHRWVGGSQISDNLRVAVIASEDAKFCTHDGFDYEAIQKAEKYNATHRKKRGASTISQQTAKNVFLWPDRSWVRKGFEVYYTFLIEHLWPKERIMTVYLNSIEWAPGVYGAEAASQHWFHHSANSLSTAEAAQLAAILPNPIKRKARPNKRSGHIQAAARQVDNQGLDVCAED